MAVTITQQPPRLNFSRNYISAKAFSSRFVVQAAQSGYWRFNFSNKMTNGQIFTLELDEGRELIFTASDNPDDSGKQIPTAGATVSDWIDNILPYLAQHPVLSFYQSVTKDGNAAIRFTPVNLTDATVFNLVDAPFPLDSANAPVIPIYNRDIFLVCTPVEVKANGKEQRLPPKVLSPKPDGSVLFEVSDIIDYQMEEFLPDQTAGLSFPNVVPGINKQFYLHIAEYSSENDEFYKAEISDKFRVQKGGLSLAEFPGYLSNDADQLIKLTWEGLRAVSRSQPEWIFFLINSSSENWECGYDLEVVTVNTVTGDLTTETVSIDFSGINSLRPIIFPLSVAGLSQLYEVGPQKLGSAKITFRFKKDGVEINDTIVQEYEFLDADWREQIWVYQNSFGVPVSLRTTSHKSHRNEIVKEEFEHRIPEQPDSTTSTMGSYNEYYRPVIEFETEVRGISKLSLLTELALNSNIYLFDNFAYLAYTVKENKLDTGKTEQNSNTIQLTASRAVRERNLSLRYAGN